MSIRTLVKRVTLPILFASQLLPSTVDAAIVSRIYNFQDGSILTGAQLNAEFNNLVNNINTLDETNLISNANILPAQINATIAGSAINRDGSTGALSVNVDGVGISINGGALVLANLGVLTANINDLAVTTGKIAANAVTFAKLDPAIVDNSTLEASSTVHVKDAGITSAKLASNLNLPGNTVQENGKNVVVNDTNISASLKIVRGFVSGAGSIISGEGFTTAYNSVGAVTVSFTNGFSSGPVIVGSVDGSNGTFATGSTGTGSFVANRFNASTGAGADYAFAFIAIGPR